MNGAHEGSKREGKFNCSPSSGEPSVRSSQRRTVKKARHETQSKVSELIKR